MVHQHELAPGHFDLPNPQSFQLHDHRVHGEIVIAVGAYPDVEPSRCPQGNCCSSEAGRHCLHKAATRDKSCWHCAFLPALYFPGNGRDVTSAFSSPIAQVMASVIICCNSGLSQFSATCPSVV